MPRSVDELMLAIIDYAGLFPPAKLPLEPALRNFAAYRKATHRRMLARFICPAGRLVELDAHAGELFRADEPPWRFSVLGSSGLDAECFAAALVGDVEAMRAFMEAHDDLRAGFACRAITEAIETRLPDSVVTNRDGAAKQALVRQTADTVRSLDALLPTDTVGLQTDAVGLQTGAVQIFIEIPFLGEWRRNTRSAISAIAAYNAETAATEHGNPVGVKIRTGGVKASMIPSIEQVAFFIHNCRENRVPFKATAGLHHPLRHDSSEVDVKTKMHGFLNVFGTAILSHALGLSESILREMLEDESAESFSFDDNGLRWRDRRASSDQITRARREFAISFGSCSFVEPIEDLRKLGLL